MQEKFDVWNILGTTGLIGTLIGLGQLFASGEKLTWGIVIGRAMISAGLAMSATAAIAFVPDIHPIAIYGIGAALVSLGTSGIERMFQIWTGKTKG